MLEALLAGCGLFHFGRLFQNSGASLSEPKQRSPNCVFAAIFFSLVAVPILSYFLTSGLAHNQTWLKLADFDAMLPPTAWNPSAAKRDLICAAVFSLVSLTTFFYFEKRTSLKEDARPIIGRIVSAPAILVLALIISFVSQGSLSKLSLPLQSKFFYPETELLEKLQNSESRVLLKVLC